jgi:hypothetical protein
MKNLALMTMVAGSLVLTAVSVSARDNEQRSDYSYNENERIALTWPWSDRLDNEINHLNRMRGHVRWQLRNYRVRNPQIRRDFAEVSRDIDRINGQFRPGGYNRRHLRREVERAHAELHRIELALRVKPRDFYPWR